MIALITIALLSATVALVLQTVSNRYMTTFQVASWQEALFAAEAGADVAMVELRQKAGDGGYGWTTTYPTVTPADVWYVGTLVSGTGENAIYNFTTPASAANASVFPKRLITTLTRHAGEGNQVLKISVVVDAPASLGDAQGRQWYRVRSTGIAYLPGPARLSSNKLNGILRRLNLRYARDNITGTVSNVTTPFASRTIECIAKPATMFGQALMSQVQVKNDGAGMVVDSYDSGDPTKSTLGNYDVTKRQSNGDVGSNAYPVKHDKTIDLNLNNDYIFGDVGNNWSKIKGLSPGYFDGADGHPTANTNPLILTDGSADPTGEVATDFYRDLPRIKTPNWPTVDRNLGSLDAKDADLVVSSDRSHPTRVVADKINLSKDTFVVKLPTGATEGYVEIWVKGDITLKDGGIFQLEPGVRATVYFSGDVNVSDSAKLGGGFDVQSDKPGDLLLLGIEKAEKDKTADAADGTTYTPYKATGKIVLKDADLIGAVYAPDHNMVIDVKGAAKRLLTNDGKGRSRLQTGVDVYGAFVGRNIQLKGPANVHYDEALNDVGPFNDYGYISWYEMVNLDRR